MAAHTYSAQKSSEDGIEIVRLTDSAHGAEVDIVPSIGNNAYRMTVHGKPVLWSPYKTLAEFKAKPTFLGVPFLAPWANRLDGEGYFANGKKYLLNPGLRTYRYDQHNQPMHGLLSYAAGWEIVALHTDGNGAEVTSRMEFWRHPDWMAQFPFAHSIEMTHRLSGGALTVRTVIHNLSVDTMPLSVAFHPYFTVPDAARDTWQVRLPVGTHYTLSPTLIPTGETAAAGLPEAFTLAGHSLDDVYGEVRHGEAFSVEGGGKKIEVRFGAKFPVAVVYAPPARDFICFEPMTGITDAFNLAQSGAYKTLQTIPPGGTWEESFSITPTGY